jgi:hypothetical protein
VIWIELWPICSFTLGSDVVVRDQQAPEGRANLMESKSTEPRMLEAGEELVVDEVVGIDDRPSLGREDSDHLPSLDVPPAGPQASACLAVPAVSAAARERGSLGGFLPLGVVTLPWTKLRCTKMRWLESSSFVPN